MDIYQEIFQTCIKAKHYFQYGAHVKKRVFEEIFSKQTEKLLTYEEDKLLLVLSKIRL